MLEIEARFDIAFPDDALTRATFQTLGGLAALVRRQSGAGCSGMTGALDLAPRAEAPTANFGRRSARRPAPRRAADLRRAATPRRPWRR